MLSQARGAIYDGFIKKTGGRGTSIERGRRSTASPASSSTAPSTSSCSWTRHGFISDEATYLAGTVLLWNRDDLLLGSRAT